MRGWFESFTEPLGHSDRVEPLEPFELKRRFTPRHSAASASPRSLSMALPCHRLKEERESHQEVRMSENRAARRPHARYYHERRGPLKCWRFRADGEKC
jgi:hypothetical protein